MNCVHCGNPSFSSSSAPFLCSTCASIIFPFNHYCDDNEFNWSVYSYFHLSQNVNVDKIRKLRVNPFVLNNDINDKDNLFSEMPFCNDNCDNSSYNNCNYMFCEDFKDKITDYSPSFSIIHINARSLNKNFDELQLLLSTFNYDFDIIAVSETWFHPYTNLDIFHLQGYSLVQLCRLTKHGGGVAFYVKHNVEFKFRSDLSCTTPEYEIISLEINRNQEKSTIVSCVYRPPNSDILSFTSKINSC